MYWFAYIITWIFVRILCPCKVIGKENVRKKSPAIIISNHLSNFDPFYIGEYLPEKKYFLAKKELFTNKFKSWLFRSIGMISIDRKSNDLTAIKNSLKVLKNGKKLIMFPEGTRNKLDEELKQIKNGAAMIAIKARVPIIPVHIEKRGKLFRKNKMTIGKPFELNEFYDQKLTAEILSKAGEIIVEKLKNVNYQQK